MFSVLLRLIHFLDFQQVAHTTLLKVHKKTSKNVSLLVITSAVVFWNTFYVILHLYRTLVWSKALFKESILFLAESRSVPQFGPHRLFFGKEILAIILFSESFSSDTEPEKMKYLAWNEVPNVIFLAFCALHLTDCANYFILYFDSCMWCV